MVENLHCPVLLDPQLADDDIVHTACGVGPRVGFLVPAGPSTAQPSSDSVDHNTDMSRLEPGLPATLVPTVMPGRWDITGQ